MHECSQQERIEKIELALFGDDSKNEKGAVQLIKETHRTVNEMKPTHKLIKDAETFADVSMKVGKWMLFMIVFITTLVGAIYGLKEWIKK